MVTLRSLDFVPITSTREQARAMPEDPTPTKPDPADDYWTLKEVAAYWGITYTTARTYRSRGRGELPEPDKVFGRSPAWKPTTIINHPRPGQGARTDLKPDGAQ